MALWSERRGERRGLNNVDFRNALFEVLDQLQDRRLFFEAWGEGYMGWGGYIADPERWVRDNLKEASLWDYLAHPSAVYGEWDPETANYPKPKKWSLGLLFDIIELLHRDAVAVSGEGPGDHDQDAGRRIFNSAVNPVLAQLEPPMVLTGEGHVTEVADVAKTPIGGAVVRRDGPGGSSLALTDDVYNHILMIVKQVGDGMELAPATYSRLGEESRRDIYLVTLNTHYENQTAGEAFNHSGKTDLRVRHEGNNVFIGECKIWYGPKTFRDALDQLFGYAAWRDTKLALIMFVPNQKMSDVIAEAKKLVDEHPQFVAWQNGHMTDHPMCARVHWRGDADQQADLAVFLVHLPE